jgi:hypothetical protein
MQRSMKIRRRRRPRLPRCRSVQGGFGQASPRVQGHDDGQGGCEQASPRLACKAAATGRAAVSRPRLVASLAGPRRRAGRLRLSWWCSRMWSGACSAVAGRAMACSATSPVALWCDDVGAAWSAATSPAALQSGDGGGPAGVSRAMRQTVRARLGD